MEENKVILSLEEYLKLHDIKKEMEKELVELGIYLMNCVEYSKKKDSLEFNKYNITDSEMMRILEVLLPDECESKLQLFRTTARDNKKD